MSEINLDSEILQSLKKRFEKDLFRFMGIKLDPVPVKPMRQTTLDEFDEGEQNAV